MGQIDSISVSTQQGASTRSRFGILPAFRLVAQFPQLDVWLVPTAHQPHSLLQCLNIELYRGLVQMKGSTRHCVMKAVWQRWPPELTSLVLFVAVVRSRIMKQAVSLLQERIPKTNSCPAHPQGHLQPFCVIHQLLTEKHLLCSVWQWEYWNISSGNGQAGRQVRILVFRVCFFLTVVCCRWCR